MNYELIFTPFFEKQLKQLNKKYPSLKIEIALLGEQLILNPFMGEPLGKKCYKIRMSLGSKKSGKSGGARIITHVAFINKKIYLISIYDKVRKKAFLPSFLNIC